MCKKNFKKLFIIMRHRLIGRIDIKNEYVIKGIQMEGLRKIGDPVSIALNLYKQGIDELIFMDAVASLYGRNNLFNIIDKACEHIFIPITIGGGIRSLDDIENALHSGADKVAINSAAVRNEKLITEASKAYGSQAIIGSIEAKKNQTNWEIYLDSGREPTGIDAIQWSKHLEALGAGELLVTSIDCDGTKKGFDKELSSKISSAVDIPVIFGGGLGKLSHLDDLLENSNAIDAISIASMFHYKLATVCETKSHLKNILKQA
jgi:cyclase